MADASARMAAAFPAAALPALATYLRGQVAQAWVYTPAGHAYERLRSFRGNKLVEVMLASKAQGLAAVTTEEEAVAVCTMLLTATPKPLMQRYAIALDGGKSVKHKDCRVVLALRDPRMARVFDASPDKSAGGRYVWQYEDSLQWRTVQLALLALAVFSCCMYQLWPLWARSVVWYISVTLLLVILGIMVLQGILFVLVWPTAWDFWLLPNFTSDTAPIWELFTPVYTLRRSESGSTPLRLGVVALLGAGAVYVARLPQSEFQEFLASQAKIVDDLYTGALLTDGSEGGDGTGVATGGRFHNPMSPFGSKWGPGSGRYGSARASHISSLEEIEKAAAEEEAREAAAAAAAAAAATDAAAGGSSDEGGAGGAEGGGAGDHGDDAAADEADEDQQGDERSGHAHAE